MKSVALGCGLISLGRVWGTHSEFLSDDDAFLFLNKAFEMGIDFFDTAPSYGDSEEKLGRFLRSLSDGERDSVVAATKFGEMWNPVTEKSYCDHSLNGLISSVENSLEKLGRIDILQLHKTSPEILQSDAFLSAVKYARKLGVLSFGVSITDFESAQIACELDFVDWIQLPYNKNWMDQEQSLDWVIGHNKKVLINRPFDSGKILSQENMKKAFELIWKKDFEGYVLTGTSSIKHLEQNINIWRKILNDK
ncbi:MAG: hypothetical protein DRG30_06685 [Epsilonproteobacteria bacterium]|nr:MAG: hypothetical protein DRG30_06685 [Campylobacterota bacterium]